MTVKINPHWTNTRTIKKNDNGFQIVVNDEGDDGKENDVGCCPIVSVMRCDGEDLALGWVDGQSSSFTSTRDETKIVKVLLLEYHEVFDTITGDQ